MARGIVELAAERLAASTPPPAPEPEPADDSTAAAIARAALPPVRRPTRSALGGRLPLTSRPAQPVSPPPGNYPDPSAQAYLPELSARAAYPDEASALEIRERAHPGFGDHDVADVYPRTANRPAGLPASVRLPAELPDNLWPPPGMLARHATENLYVPGAVPPDAPSPVHEDEPAATTEELPATSVYVPTPSAERPTTPPAEGPATSPAERHERPTASSPAEAEHEEAFLPAVLSRGDDADHAGDSAAESGSRHAASSPGPRMVRRRRRAMLVAYLILITLVLVAGHQLRDEEQPLAPGREAAQRAAEPAGVGPAETVPDATAPGANVPAATPQAQAEPTAAADEAAGTGEFRYAKDRGPMLGTAGRLYRFKVAVEKTVDDAPADVAERIDDTLGDDRSWTNDGRLRMRRVANSAGNADFTIYLASAGTSEKMCAAGGLETAGFTSCRVPGKVIINAERWSEGVPDYEGHLEEYRRYTINHEVGHELGHGHEACPGDGEKAPVMMQQTYGLKGCTRNSWPYLDSKRYAGEPVA